MTAKFIILGFLVFLGFAIPDKSVSVAVNVKQRPRFNDRRDTLPNVEMSFAPVVHQSTRLTYDFYTLDGGVVVRNVNWMKAFAETKNKKFTARINRVNADGNVVQTLYSGELNCEFMNLYILNFGIYKINVWQVGGYCNGIEYDFRWFGKNDVTPIQQFNHHLILCQ